MAESSETTQVAGAGAGVDVAEALRALSVQVGELRDEVESLRDEQRALPLAGVDAHGWEHRPALAASGPAWARNLDSPAARRPTVPRFALEIAFLVVVAAIAAAARLDPPVIVAVLATGWALVALSEWLAWRSARRDEALLAGLSVGGQRVQSDLSWFAPPVEPLAEPGEASAASPPKLPPARAD